ncbi:hypothetical protein BB560_000921 [Smittium megazygosporum]|uniref:Protein kinase domain-containing protein n=1 Tax=Smittium megazygosporum TaxID=133381 RepID=A0A2T9ZIY9_9FUNG|nr:hypothetical protein BB560_000921 [Smittium megazygosporum]
MEPEDPSNITNMDLFEHQKENIQPLKRGRSARMLAKVFGPSDSQSSNPSSSGISSGLSSNSADISAEQNTTNWLQIQKDKFEEQISKVNLEEDDDPLDVYFNYSKWLVEVFPASKGNSIVIKALETPLRLFKSHERYRNDPRLLKMWLWYIELINQSQEEIFQYLLSNQIGASLSLFYEEYAKLLEANLDFSKADQIFQLGINRNAQPLLKLKKGYSLFQQRLVEYTKLQIESDSLPQSNTNFNPPDQKLSTVSSSHRKILGVKESSEIALSVQANTNRSYPNNIGSSTASSHSKIKVYRDNPLLDNSEPSSFLSDQKWPEIGTDTSRRKENILESSKWRGQRIPQLAPNLHSNNHNHSNLSRNNQNPSSFKVFQDKTETSSNQATLSDSAQVARPVLASKAVDQSPRNSSLLDKLNSENPSSSLKASPSAKGLLEKESLSKPKEKTYYDLNLIYPGVNISDGLDLFSNVVTKKAERSIEEARSTMSRYIVPSSSSISKSRTVVPKEHSVNASSQRKNKIKRLETITAFDTDSTIILDKSKKPDTRALAGNESFDSQNSDSQPINISSPTIHTIDAQRQMLEIWQGNADSSDGEMTKEFEIMEANQKLTNNPDTNDDYQFTMGPVAPNKIPKDHSFGLLKKSNQGQASTSSFSVFRDEEENKENVLPNKHAENAPHIAEPQKLAKSSNISILNEEKRNQHEQGQAKQNRKVLQEKKAISLDCASPENNKNHFPTFHDENREPSISFQQNQQTTSASKSLENEYNTIPTSKLQVIPGAHTLDSMTAMSNLGYIETSMDSNILYTSSLNDPGFGKSSFTDFPVPVTKIMNQTTVPITPKFPKSENQDFEYYGSSDDYSNIQFNDQTTEQSTNSISVTTSGFLDTNSKGLNHESRSIDHNNMTTENSFLANSLYTNKSEYSPAIDKIRKKHSPSFKVFSDSSVHFSNNSNTQGSGKIVSDTLEFASANVSSASLVNSGLLYAQGVEQGIKNTILSEGVVDYDLIYKVIDPFWPIARNVYLTILDKVETPVESFLGYYDCIDFEPMSSNIAKINSLIINSAAKKRTNENKTNYIFENVPFQLRNNQNSVVSLFIHNISAVGGFAQIYLASEQKEGSEYQVLKVEMPANAWEFYIIRILEVRLAKNSSQRVRSSKSLFISPVAVYEYTDLSITQFEYLRYGTLIDCVNLYTGSVEPGSHKPKHKKKLKSLNSNDILSDLQYSLARANSRGIDEPLALLLVSQLIRAVLSMHKVKVVHTDLKPENVMLDFGKYIDKMDSGESEKELLKSCIFSSKDNKSFLSIIKVIDFGRSIDWSVFHEGQPLRKKPTSMVEDVNINLKNRANFDPIESGDVPVWSPHADWIGVARIACVLLFGNRMTTTESKPSEFLAGICNIKNSESNTFRRYWNTDLWIKLFETCLSGIIHPYYYSYFAETGLKSHKVATGDEDFLVFDSAKVWKDCVVSRIDPQMELLADRMDMVLLEYAEQKKKLDNGSKLSLALRKLCILSNT